MNQPADRDEARRLTDAATPGPWRWLGNVDSADIRLQTRYGHGLTVLGFARHGMRGAQPVFQVDGMLVDGKDLVRYEVAPEATSRKDPKVYRGDINGIRHPDAEFIAAARSLVPALLDELDATVADRDQLRTELATKNERLAMLEGARATTNRLLALQTKAVERLRAQVQAAKSEALNEFAEWYRTAHKDYGSMVPGIVHEYVARAAALVPTNPEPAQRSSNVCPGCNGHGRTQMFVVCPDCMGSGTFDNDGADSTEYEKSFADHEDHRSIVERASQRFRESGYTGDTVNISSVGILTDQPDPETQV